MKITLRKANALQNSIQDHIKTIEVKTVISLNEFQIPAAEIACARDGVSTNDARRVKLTRAFYNVRASVGRANVETGIADLLTEAAYIDKRIAQLKGLTETEATDADAVVTGKLEKIRNDKSDRRMYGYNDTVNVGVLTSEQIEVYKAEVRNLKKQKQSINDKVLELNVRNDIELDADTVAVLQTEQLV
jgi:hypothetical protein